jgi:chorismate synthase
VDRQALDGLMDRRQRGFGTGGRMRIEADQVQITAGVLKGATTGAPIAIRIANRDHASWRDRDVPPMTVPRPGHADLAAAVKYGYDDLRLGLERASARETAARVAVGGLCLQLLGHAGVRIGSYVVAIGEAVAELPDTMDYAERFAAAEASDVRCPEPAAAEAMRDAIRRAIEARDTVGGIFEVVVLDAPPGLGSHVHWDRRLTGRLLGAVTSIPAVRGAEIGAAFRDALCRGTEVHARYGLDGGAVTRQGGPGTGLEGGITTGEPIVIRAAMKPISTTLTPLPSVDLATGRAAETRYERSDFCAVPRAAVVAEAVIAIVIAEALLEKAGGDSLDEVLPRVAGFRRATLDQLPLANRPWRLATDDNAG